MKRNELVLSPGVRFLPGYFDRPAQDALVETIRAVVSAAPLFVPRMPRTGKPMSVKMTNCGSLGWVTDKESGYRYQPTHPVTGAPWPDMPAALLDAWRRLAGFTAAPEACLVNFYAAGARMGLHVDADENEVALVHARDGLSGSLFISNFL